MESLTLNQAWLAPVRRLRWELMRLHLRGMRSIGWPAYAVLVAGLACGVLAGRVAFVSAEGRQSAAAPPRPAPAPTVPGWVSEAERARSLVRALPMQHEIPVVLRALLSSAKRSGMDVTSGDYRLQADGDTGVLVYRMVLPVSGRADVVHRYLQQSLRDHPSLSVDGVEFERETLDSEVVQARLRLALYVQQSPAERNGTPVPPTESRQ